MDATLTGVVKKGYLKATISAVNKINGTIKEKTISATSSVPKVIKTAEKPYEGEMYVIPRIEDQVLQTNNRYFMDDLTVGKIPIYETSNPEGGETVYIG